MTPLGHVSISYICGKTIKRFSLFGLMAGAIIPDLDWLLYPFDFFNKIHRVFSHNIFFTILLAFIGFLLAKRGNKIPVMLGLFFGMLLHIFFDSIIDTNPSNGIGVAWFWPLSERHYAPFNLAGKSLVHGLNWNTGFIEIAKVSMKYFLFEIPFILIFSLLVLRDIRNKHKRVNLGT